MKGHAAISAAFALLTAMPASAMQLTGCDTPPGYRSLTARADLPPALRNLFKDFVMPGEEFNEGDVGGPGQGVISIWHRGRRWILEAGHGGIALSFDVTAFDVSADGSSVQPLPPLKDGALYCAAVREYAALR
jgi:hypothetical protein